MIPLKKSKRNNVELLRKELIEGSKFVKFSMNIPRSLHEQFRKKAFLDDKDMKDVLIEAICKYVRM